MLHVPDLCSSSEKGETWAFCCHSRAVIEVQFHARKEQTDVFGRFNSMNFMLLGFEHSALFS